MRSKHAMASQQSSWEAISLPEGCRALTDIWRIKNAEKLRNLNFNKESLE